MIDRDLKKFVEIKKNNLHSVRVHFPVHQRWNTRVRFVKNDGMSQVRTQYYSQSSESDAGTGVVPADFSWVVSRSGEAPVITERVTSR